jgi:Zn finger protein HypA/HybF involved in hydrogenase expression
MVRKAECECPCCGWPMRAWYQSDAMTVTCPTCLRNIPIEESSAADVDEPHHGDMVGRLLLLLRGVLSW